jgi:uncharacterized DUF497 family protein
LKYEWDKVKNALNIQNHGISFEEAMEVFDDPLHIAKLDFRFNYFEERWITLGATSQYKLIVVAHMLFNDKNEEVIRIISARKANSKEVNLYEQ